MLELKTDKLISDYYKRLANESRIKKFLSQEQVEKLSSMVTIVPYNRLKYSSDIKNPLEIVLNFYRKEFPSFYTLIDKGIKNGHINLEGEGSYVSTSNGSCHIKLNFNDADVFMIAHEFGHYIALNSNPPIIDKYYFKYAEVLSIYMEKRLKRYLISKHGFTSLVNTREYNRLYFESRMISVAVSEYKYEQLYKEGKLALTDRDVNNILKILRIAKSNSLNIALTYPLGNIISEYLIDHNITIDGNLINVLASLNIDELLNTYQDIFKKIEVPDEEKRISNFFGKI